MYVIMVIISLLDVFDMAWSCFSSPAPYGTVELMVLEHFQALNDGIEANIYI